MSRLQDVVETLSPSSRMPVLFVGHGNPMNAILENDITHAWQKVGKDLPEAQAIVVISAHWLTHGTHITDAPTQPIIYDMYGFPDELYKVEYPALGSPDIAKELQKAMLAYEAKLDSTWGLDHGTWSILKHIAPKPKVPILQISLDYTQPLENVVELFKELKPLRDKGVIFIGSGNIVHNLRALNFANTKPFDWALEFDDTIATAISSRDMRKLTSLSKLGTIAQLAVPTDDHYRPMLAALTLLDEGENIDFFNETIDLGSIGMRSFVSSM